MSDNKLFCYGCGYTAKYLAAMLLAENWSVSGTTRSPEKAASLRETGISPVIWDDDLSQTALEDATAILVSTAPTENGCPALKAAETTIVEHKDTLRWIGYLSTNGVYGDYDGAWVNEQSPLRATSSRARRRIEAEKAWRNFADAHNIPLIIFRLPGIYGPGRSALDTVRAGKAKRLYKEGQVFSRAHVHDIAQALLASIKNPEAGDLFNIADDEPAPPQDVISLACELLGVTPPPLIPIEEADISDMARSFYADNKRVNNKRMKEALGITLTFPTYREGLSTLHIAETR